MPTVPQQSNHQRRIRPRLQKTKAAMAVQAVWGQNLKPCIFMPTTNPSHRSKYHRPITTALPNGEPLTVWVDVYDVLEIFKRDGDSNFRQCLPGDDAIAHAVKKLLCPGERGSKGRLQDLVEAQVALQRAIDATLNDQSE